MNSLLQRNTFKASCIFVLFVLTVCLFAFLLLASGEFRFLLLNRDRKDSVLIAFAHALMEGDRDAAQSLVTSDQKQRVAEWLNDELPVSCLSFESEGWEGGEVFIELREYCFWGGSNCIAVGEVFWAYTTDGWQIQGWEEIYEC